MSEKQTDWLWWDGKQKNLSEFIEELFGEDPDDQDNSWEAVYSKNGIDIKKQSD